MISTRASASASTSSVVDNPSGGMPPTALGLAAVRLALDRLSELAGLTLRHGRRYLPALRGPSLLAAAPEHWYREWHA